MTASVKRTTGLWSQMRARGWSVLLYHTLLFHRLVDGQGWHPFPDRKPRQFLTSPTLRGVADGRRQSNMLGLLPPFHVVRLALALPSPVNSQLTRATLLLEHDGVACGGSDTLLAPTNCNLPGLFAQKYAKRTVDYNTCVLIYSGVCIYTARSARGTYRK